MLLFKQLRALDHHHSSLNNKPTGSFRTSSHPATGLSRHLNDTASANELHPFPLLGITKSDSRQRSSAVSSPFTSPAQARGTSVLTSKHLAYNTHFFSISSCGDLLLSEISYLIPFLLRITAGLFGTAGITFLKNRPERKHRFP